MVKIRDLLTRLFSKDNVELVKTGAESAKAVVELGKAIQEKKPSLKEIQPYLGQISSLLDVLNAPWMQVVKEVIPFAPLAMTLLNLSCEHLKQEPSLEECIVMVALDAYMESWKVEVARNPDRFQGIDLSKSSKEIDRKLQKLGDLEIDSTAANQIITALPSSKLIKEFNEILIDRLVECGVNPVDARNFAERVAMGAPRYVNEMVAKQADKINVLAEIYRNGGNEVLAHYASIDNYLRKKIAPLPFEHVFDEADLQLQDIYVPLEIQPLNVNGEKTSHHQDRSRNGRSKNYSILNLRQFYLFKGKLGEGRAYFVGCLPI
jgi:hypothetical protein